MNGVQTLKVKWVVDTYDPFFGLGYQPISGGFEHLPPTPTLATLVGVTEQIEWVRNCARGVAYDLGRFAYFVNEPDRIRSAGPIYLESDGSVLDGHHRLGAAWLLGMEWITVMI